MKKVSKNKNIKSFFTFTIMYELLEISVIYRLILSLSNITKKLHSELLLMQILKIKVTECNQFVKPQYIRWRLTPF